MKNSHFIKTEEIIKYNYNGTNWKTFNKKITKLSTKEINIPNNKNLSNEEIDLYLEKINAIILKCIEKIVPKQNKTDSMLKISNTIIRKLHKEKSQLLTIIKKHHRLEHVLPDSTFNLFKAKLKNTKKLLDENIKLSLNKIIENNLSIVTPEKSKHMFDQIRKNFKKFTPLHLENVKLPQNDKHILDNIDIDESKLELDNENNFIINDKIQMLETIGSFFQNIHSEKELDFNNSTHNNVKNYFTKFIEIKNEFENNKSTITEFSDTKLSDNISNQQIDKFFIKKHKLVDIFRKFRGKLSSGVDGIPNIVLKKLPDILNSII